MAILLRLDRAQYFQGAVRVYRGDQWDLTGQVVDQIGSVVLAKDLTGASATAYFPATGGGVVAAVVSITDEPQGLIRIAVGDDVTPMTEVGQVQVYVIVDGIPSAGHPFTAQMPEPDLAIVDRSFQQF